VIGRTSRSFPHSKPDVRLSPHPAFQIEPGYSRRADPTSVSGTHQGSRLTRPSSSAFPCKVCGLWFRGNGGHSVHHASRCRKALSWRTFTLSVPLQDSIWLLCRLRHPSRSLAFSRLSAWLVPGTEAAVKDFPHSAGTDDRTLSGLLHAGWLGDNTVDVRRSNALHHTILVPVIQPLHRSSITALTRRFLASA
jgi:hypothetical protein